VNATFNNISVVSWWSVLLVEKTNVALYYDNMKYHKDTINSKNKIVE
jgi:hypothetical protein